MTSAALIAVGLPATATATAVPGATARAGTVEARAGAMNVRLTADQSAALLAGAADWGSVAKALRLGEREALVPKSVSKDADGTLHTRYDRTFAGLPVLGGDLVVHTTPAGGVKGVTKASSATISLPSTTARKTADSARSFAESQARTDGIKPAEVKSPARSSGRPPVSPFWPGRPSSAAVSGTAHPPSCTSSRTRTPATRSLSIRQS